MSDRTTAEIVADLRRHTCIVTEPDGLYAWKKIDLPSEAAHRLAKLDAEVKRLAGGDSCEVCGSTDPAVRNIMPDNVGRRLFPDAPDVHEMACYSSNYHDPQDAIRVLGDAIEYADSQNGATP